MYILNKNLAGTILWTGHNSMLAVALIELIIEYVQCQTRSWSLGNKYDETPWSTKTWDLIMEFGAMFLFYYS